jgi:hypothetical protein
VALWGFWYIDTNYPLELTNVVDVSAGHRHFAALRGDGTVVCWGYTNMGATAVPPGLSNVIAISCGGYHTLALRRDGTVVTWGGSSGVTSVPSDASNVVAIAAGYLHNVALRDDGRVVLWGETNFVSEFSNVVAIAAGLDYSLALVTTNAPLSRPCLAPPQLQQGMLRATVPTLRGRRYFVEETTALAMKVWQSCPVFAGTGAPHDFSTSCGTSAQKYVRVRCQQ